MIGFPLSHSFSKKYFEDKFQREKFFECSYDLFELKSIDAFPAFLMANPGLVGLNVTIPYKEAVLPFMEILSPEAKEIGAVNCIRLVGDVYISGRGMEGYNTDCYGFEISLQNFLDARPEQTFILGSGGSSKAVEFVLKKMNLPFLKVSRQQKAGCIRYSDIALAMKKKNLFINTTPVGMFPEIGKAPEIPYHLLSDNDFLFDLVYNPGVTEFLKCGKIRGAKIKNGLEMLELQAEKSWEIWNS